MKTSPEVEVQDFRAAMTGVALQLSGPPEGSRLFAEAVAQISPPFRKKIHRFDATDNFAGLIKRLEEGDHHPPIRLRARRPCFEHRNPEAQFVPGPDGAKPAQFVHTRRRKTRDGGEVIVDEQAHHETGRMPTARYEPTERALGGLGWMGVNGLWIKALGEGNDFRFFHLDRTKGEDGTLAIVFEVPVVDWNGKA